MKNIQKNNKLNENQVTILGAGESGFGAAILAKQKGYDVFVSDVGEIKSSYQKGLEKLEIEYEHGYHTEDKILASKEIIKSPGIPDTAPIIKKAIEKGIPVISEIEFAARYTEAKIIAVTGSNGKTTTTMLVHHILKQAGYNVGVAGNIGNSFAKQVAEDDFFHLGEIPNNKKHYVLELSSFQLDGIKKFRPDVAIILNITPDHLDRYENNFENYVNSKLRITKNQTFEDTFIYWQNDKNVVSKLSQIESTKVPFGIEGKEVEFSLKGKHNQLNAQAAILAALAVGVETESIKTGLASFEPVKHRLQVVENIDDIVFINDSKATNVDAVYYALEGIEETIIWIAGGVDKGNDYTALYPFVGKIKALICLGKDNEKLKKAFGEYVLNIDEAESMQEAVSKSIALAESGDVVLLSPACASFDLFKSYEHRGDEFVNEIGKLKIEA